MALTRRPLEVCHLASITEIAKESFEVVWAPREFTHFLTHSCGLCVGLFEGEELVAYFIGLLVRGELDIVSVATAQAQRRKGLAQRLLKDVCELPGVKKAFLEVAAHNEPAIALYRKLGFVETGVRKKYYQQKWDALLMKWEKT